MFQLENEEWRTIPTYPDYMISSLGRVYSVNADKYLSVDKRNSVNLSFEGKQKGWAVHVLMGCTFLENNILDPYRHRVLFKDGNSSNLNLSNLYVEDTSDLDGEEWKQIKTAAGRPIQDFYYVSNYGRVKSVKHDLTWLNYGKQSVKCVPEMILAQTYSDSGYLSVWLSALEKPGITAQVHRLVAAAFCSNADPEHNDVVNHLDGDPSNNRADNLEWTTPAGNAQHAVRTGLRGDWTGRKLRYPVLHVETGKLYNSITAVDAAIGRAPGYCSNHLELGKTITDIEGNIWTLQVLKDTYLRVHTNGQHCTIDEFPGKEFISLEEASMAIGRWGGYISDALKRGGRITNKAGEVMHVHLIGDAPVVPANEVRAQRKAAGLIPGAKQRKKSEWTSRKSLRRIETGEIYASMSEASRAMGKKAGYVGECFAFDRDCIDANGNKWTFEMLDEMVTVRYAKNECYIEEFPDKLFANLSEASEFIGRDQSYIPNRITEGKPILTPSHQLLHFHFTDPQKEEQYVAKVAQFNAEDTVRNKDRKTKFQCYFEEMPDQSFSSFSKASAAFGKGPSFVRDKVYSGQRIFDDAGTEFHIHFFDPEIESSYQARLKEQEVKLAASGFAKFIK